MSEAEFFVGPPPADSDPPKKVKPKPKPKPESKPEPKAESSIIISTPAQAAIARSRPVSERTDDPGELLHGLLGSMPGMTRDMAAGLTQSALNAGHNAVVEGRNIQRRAARNLRKKKRLEQGGRGRHR